jgi:hypothetical protein
MIQVTPAELRSVLTLTSKAPTTFAEAHALHDVVERLVALANQPHPMQAVAPFVPKFAGDTDPASSDSV